MSVGGPQHRARQARPRVGNQGTDENQLRRVRRLAVTAAHAPVAAGAPEAPPVRGAVDRAGEARRIDERLQQHRRMAKARRPVRRQAPLAQPQQPRGQVGPMTPRQDEKTGVVRHQVQPVVLRAKIPTDPAVAHAALQRRRRKNHQRHPLAPPAPHVPQRLADLRHRPQVVVRVQQAPKTTLLSSLHRLNNDLAQLQPALPMAPQRGGLYTPPRRECPVSDLTLSFCDRSQRGPIRPVTTPSST